MTLMTLTPYRPIRFLHHRAQRLRMSTPIDLHPSTQTDSSNDDSPQQPLPDSPEPPLENENIKRVRRPNPRYVDSISIEDGLKGSPQLVREADAA